MDFRLTDDEAAVVSAGAQVAGSADPWAALVSGGWLDITLDDPADGFRYLGLVAEQLGAAGPGDAHPGTGGHWLIGSGAVWPALFGAGAGGRRVGVAGLPPPGGLLAGGLLAEDGAGADVVVVVRDGRAEAFDSFRADRVAGLGGDGLARLEVTGPATTVCEDPARLATAGLRAGALAAAEMAGTVRRVADMTVAHVREREQFGRPIAKFQVVAHGAAHLAVLAEAATWAARAACTAPTPETVHAAKGWISRAGQEVSALAHQLHGAIGFTEEYGLQHLTKRLRTLRFAWGDDAHHHRALGRLRAGAV